MTPRRPAPRRRLVVASIAIATLAVVVTVGVLRRRAGDPGRPSAAKADEEPRARDLRAGLPAWARDPDAAPGAVSGIVETPEGQPVEGALVAIIPEVETPTSDIRVKPAATARSGRDGRFQVPRVRPGEYGATATAEGFGGAFRGGLAVLPGETVEGVQLVLERGGVLLTGRIADSGGGPVPRAELRVLPGLPGAKPSRLFQVLADDAGQYRVTLPRARYFLVADADGYAPESRLVDTNATRNADFLLNPAARVAGRVFERTSAPGGSARPVADATVILESTHSWWQFPRETRSNAEGRFELRDLDAGSYRLSGHRGPLVGRVAGSVDVAVAARTNEVDLYLVAGATVSGRVTERTEGGKPVAGARVRLASSELGVGARVRAQTDAEGGFRIEGVLPGRLALSAEAPGRAPASREVVVSAGKDLDGVALVLMPEAQVLGKVLTPDEKPVAGATVSARITEAVTAGGGWATDRTDDRGDFRLGGLGAGTLHVEAEVAERGRASYGPEPLASGETRKITLTLQPGASISGTVTWDDGTPAPGVTVSAVQPATLGMAQTRTGADGSYRAGPLAAGQTVVTASRKEGYGGMMEMEVNPGETGQRVQMVTVTANERKRGVDLVVPKGGHKVSGVVVGPDGKPLAGASVGADPEGNVMGGMRAAMGAMLPAERVLSAEDGRFTIEDLTKGPYVVWAKHPGLPDARVEKVPTGAQEVRVAFKSPAVLAGVVVDPSGKPVADYNIGVLESAATDDNPQRKGERTMKNMAAMFGGGAARQAVNDPRGAFELGGLAAGKYDLVASTGDGRVGKLASIAVAAGERKAALRVVLQPGVVVRGKLVDFADGRPAAGVPVVIVHEQQPLFRAAGADGSFRIEGLMAGRSYEMTVGGPMTAFISDRFEVALPAGKTEVDAGTLKLVRGQMTFDGAVSTIGVQVELKGGRPLIERVLPGTAAAEAGLKAGQWIRTIDGRDVAGLGGGGVRHLLNGAAGTTVQLGVAGPPAPDGHVVTLERRARPAR